nr:MAG TPA: hypothetical protein [Caudoviricetes sp.]
MRKRKQKRTLRHKTGCFVNGKRIPITVMVSY